MKLGVVLKLFLGEESSVADGALVHQMHVHHEVRRVGDLLRKNLAALLRRAPHADLEQLGVITTLDRRLLQLTCLAR